MKNRIIYTCILLGTTLTLCSANPPEQRPHMREGHRPPPVDRYMEMLKSDDPDEYKRMVKLRQEDPQAFRMNLRKKARQIRKDEDEKARTRPHPLQEQIEAVQQASDAEAREIAISKLREAVSERVEKTLLEREQAIEKIREKLKTLEDRNELERNSREEVVDHHLQRILDNLDKFESPPPSEK